VPGKPISVIAHSLGGVIAFDAATRSSDALWIDGFVTFGSQAAFFQVLDPRPSLPLYIPGRPIRLPETIERWTSLWEPLDVLAFAAGKVFRLHSGLAPTDVRLVHDLHSGLATHGTYWEIARNSVES
jgi:pimeloyl-ACP methyl ester carboxylesterase